MTKTGLLRVSAVGMGMAIFCAHLAAAPADRMGETVTTAMDQKEVAVTIYNDDLALVKDARRVGLERDFNRLVWRGVSAQMRPETALLRNVSHPGGFRLQEQNFDFDLLTPEKLLEKNLNKTVTVIRTNPATGAETREAATVLATSGGTVLKFADRIETGVPGRLAFSGVPENLRDKPTLVVSLVNAVAGDQDLELSYLTGGMSWHADYVAELNERDDHLDFSGWVTLTNQSGAAYPNAKLQLVAGDLNRVRRQPYGPREPMAMAAKMAEAEDMRQESLFEYHLYTLPRPTTLSENQTKQVALLSTTGISVRKEFLLAGATHYYFGQYGDIGQKLKVAVFVEFRNKGEGLGTPLPKGVVRVYKKDAQGNAQFVGEDRIDHTPRNETVRLRLGNAFDVTADKKQTDFQRLAPESRHAAVFETAYRLVLKNAKKEAVDVVVREPVPGDWTMVSESQLHTKAASGIAEWIIRVPADGEATLTYRVRARQRG